MKCSSVFQGLLAALWASAIVAQDSSTMNIAQVAESLPNTFSTLLSLVGTDNAVVDRLTGGSDTTLFAPTNNAFEALPETTRMFLSENPDVLADVLLYHAVDGSVPSSAITKQSTPVPTLLDGSVVVVQKFYHGFFCWLGWCEVIIKVNDATVVIPDVPASNGVIHAIDTVLIPIGLGLLDIVETAIQAQLATLVIALGVADLVDLLRDDGSEQFTVFAPSEDAWNSLPPGLLLTLLLPTNKDALSDILRYHVVVGEAVSSDQIVSDGSTTETANGNTITLTRGEDIVLVGDSTDDDANVITADVKATNGIVHVIDKVLIPVEFPFPMRSIVDSLKGDEDLSQLLAAVMRADIVEELNSALPLTLLAPTNAAFVDLDIDTLDPEDLRSILFYHVIPGAFKAETVSTLNSAPTLNGQFVDISREGDTSLFINNAEVVVTDILASNGVIHKINAVLMPDEQEEQCQYSDWICYFLSFF